MNFFIKSGNDAFSPSIKANNIVLDNDFENLNTITNSILANFTISSKQNALDYWIADVDYLNYVKVLFYILNSKDDVDNLVTAAKKGIAYINLFNTIQKPKYKVVSLSEIVDFSNITETNYIFNVEQEILFTDINSQDDIILLALPYIDFDSYFADNKISKDIADQLVASFYKIETYQYNILINNTIIQDNISNSILNDVRQLNELKTNFLSLLPNVTKTPLINDKKSYFSEVFSSFDYDNKIINNYFFFNIQNFIEDNCAIKKSFQNLSESEIEKILLENKCITFNIFRNNDEEIVCSFYSSFKNIGGNNKVFVIKELNTSDSICISFIDTFPKSKKASFNYKIEVSFSDPFVKKYYNSFSIPSTGLFFDVVNDLATLSTYVDDPRNSDSKTTKFVPNPSSPTLIKNKLIVNFFKIYNLFTNFDNEIKRDKLNLISSSLNFDKATIFIYNDFISFINKCLYQMEQYFLLYQNSIVTHSKESKILKFKISDFYFAKDDSNTGYETIKYYYEYNNKNSKTQYDLLSSDIDSTNIVSYKIINAILNLTDEQYTYQKEYNCIADLLSMNGTTVYKNEEFIKLSIDKKITNPFYKSSSNNSSIQSVQNTKVDIKKEIGLLKEQTDNLNLKNIINKVSLTNTLDFDTLLKFQLYFLDDINEKFLIPKIKTNVYNPKTKQWQNLNSINISTSNTAYLAKTIYISEDNIFSQNSVTPPISEEYFVLKLTNNNFNSVKSKNLTSSKLSQTLG